jgi:hypothetical protein
LLSAASIARGEGVFSQLMPMAILGRVMDVRVRRTMIFTVILSGGAKLMNPFSDTNGQKSSIWAATNLQNINAHWIVLHVFNSFQNIRKTIDHAGVLHCF